MQQLSFGKLVVELQDVEQEKRKFSNFPIPKLRLEAKDLGRTGTALFLKHINASEVLHDAVISVLTTLYTLETCPRQYVSFPTSVLTWLTCF